MKPYVLYYWAYNEYDETTTVLRQKNVLLSEENIKVLTSSTKPAFIDFLIEDGERMVMNTTYIHSFTQGDGL